jgi:hypothetical protein
MKPDLILLTETWCNTTIDNATLTIPGYNLEAELRRDREDTGQGVGRGLIVYAQLYGDFPKDMFFFIYLLEFPIMIYSFAHSSFNNTYLWLSY